MDGLMLVLIVIVGILIVVEVVERIRHRGESPRTKPPKKQKPSAQSRVESESGKASMEEPAETGESIEPDDIHSWRENRTERGIRVIESKRKRR